MNPDFTNECYMKDLLPCSIGQRVYTIDKHIKTYNPKTYDYYIEECVCGGFIIDKVKDEVKIYPAYDTWDGWVKILEHGYGYYTSREKAKEKMKELKEQDEFLEENKWIMK